MVELRRRLAALEASEAEHRRIEEESAHQGPIHLVVTDMVMPGMSGRVLVERLVTANPELKVLYMSGYSEGIAGQQEWLEPRVLFLQKPFKSSALLLKVREALHRTN